MNRACGTTPTGAHASTLNAHLRHTLKLAVLVPCPNGNPRAILDFGSGLPNEGLHHQPPFATIFFVSSSACFRCKPTCADTPVPARIPARCVPVQACFAYLNHILRLSVQHTGALWSHSVLWYVYCAGPGSSMKRCNLVYHTQTRLLTSIHTADLALNRLNNVLLPRRQHQG